MDLISRQAAIDALHTRFRDGFDGDKWWNSTHVLAAIEGLPSAQPEPQWIPVEKELPEPRIDVWVNSDLGQMVGYYDEMVNLWYGRDYLELIVNAWMPLPEAYKPNK
jgi:hypothetical protein